jgi:hypothetical protein
MASIISYQHWDGGSSSGPVEIIGYCLESPFEVLKEVLLTHNVTDYLGLYRPIDYDYPNNVTGLIIKEIDGKKNKTPRWSYYYRPFHGLKL